MYAKRVGPVFDVLDAQGTGGRSFRDLDEGIQFGRRIGEWVWWHHSAADVGKMTMEPEMMVVLFMCTLPKHMWHLMHSAKHEHTKLHSLLHREMQNTSLWEDALKVNGRCRMGKHKMCVTREGSSFREVIARVNNELSGRRCRSQRKVLAECSQGL